MLRALSGWLDKAQKQLLERLAPDMYPLSSQVCFVCRRPWKRHSTYAASRYPKR
ncbi:MAG: hypothetical protein P8Y48_02620 [Novosphingobium sp.]